MQTLHHFLMIFLDHIFERKITVEDVKYALSTHFQNTPYDPYITRGDLSNKGALRPVGINRNDFLSVLQVRQGQ